MTLTHVRFVAPLIAGQIISKITQTMSNTREIKFRLPHFNISDGSFNHFSYWGAIDHHGNHCEDHGSFYAPAQSSGTKKGWHQQFTGLKDKNGKEIYQNDIVRILYTDWPSQTPNENDEYDMSLDDYKKSISAIGYVDWDYYSTGWIIRTKSKYSVDEDGTVMTSIIHGAHGEREVIGNIYEHPHLLK